MRRQLSWSRNYEIGIAKYNFSVLRHAITQEIIKELMKKLSMTALVLLMIASNCAISSEAENISNVVDGKTEGVFLVRALGGIFPLPNRFAYHSKIGRDHEKFISGSWKVGKNGEWFGNDVPGGSVKIGERGRCLLCDGKHDKSRLRVEPLLKDGTLRMVKVSIIQGPSMNWFVI